MSRAKSISRMRPVSFPFEVVMRGVRTSGQAVRVGEMFELADGPFKVRRRRVDSWIAKIDTTAERRAAVRCSASLILPGTRFAPIERACGDGPIRAGTGPPASTRTACVRTR